MVLRNALRPYRNRICDSKFVAGLATALPVFLHPITSRDHHETYLPTLSRSSQAHPRLPRPHGDAFWPRRIECAPRQGSQAARCLTRQDPTKLGRTMSGSPEGYGRHKRIVKTDDFSSVFRLRPMHRTEHFVLYMRPNALGHARLGVVVAKRLAPRSVTRNLIKRLAREVFRHAALGAFDCIIRLSQAPLRKGSPAASSALKSSLGLELRILLSKNTVPST